jgi:hypothetical protein
MDRLVEDPLVEPCGRGSGRRQCLPALLLEIGQLVLRHRALPFLLRCRLTTPAEPGGGRLRGAGRIRARGYSATPNIFAYSKYCLPH